MAIEKLTKKELERFARGAGGYPEYVEFLSSLRAGEGGRIIVAEEGVSRQTIKNRLKKSADVAGVTIQFQRSAAEYVVFAVAGSAK